MSVQNEGPSQAEATTVEEALWHIAALSEEGRRQKVRLGQIHLVEKAGC